jgi:hypothetical protein
MIYRSKTLIKLVEIKIIVTGINHLTNSFRKRNLFHANILNTCLSMRWNISAIECFRDGESMRWKVHEMKIRREGEHLRWTGGDWRLAMRIVSRNP